MLANQLPQQLPGDTHRAPRDLDIPQVQYAMHSAHIPAKATDALLVQI